MRGRYKINIPKYQGTEEREERIQEKEVPGYICLRCKQQWSKEDDRALRDKNDPHCPFCGSKGVRKWRIKTRD